LLIGNPTTNIGTFFESQKPNSGYNRIQISAFDTPNFKHFGITLDDIRTGVWEKKVNGKEMLRPYLITPMWVSDKLKKWGEGTPMWDSRVLGQVPEQGEDTLIRLKLIESAKNREVAVLENEPEFIGADIARFGSDKTVFIYRKGARILDIRWFTKQDTMVTAEKLFAMATEYPKSIVQIDTIGVGAGVYDRMNQLIDPSRVVPINVAEKANMKELFGNRRAEMYWGLRDRFVEEDIAYGGSLPEIETLMGQLASIKFEFNRRGQILIEEKDKMKERGLPSPDFADACMMAFGVAGFINYEAINFATVKKPDLATQAAIPQPTALRVEDERKKAEYDADMQIIQQMKRDAGIGV